MDIWISKISSLYPRGVYVPFYSYASPRGKANVFRIQTRPIDNINSLHFHDHFQIFYCVNAPYCIHYRTMRYQMEYGDFLFVPPMTEHKLLDQPQSEAESGIACQIDFPDDFIVGNVPFHDNTTLFDQLYLDPLILNAFTSDPVLHFRGENRELVDEIIRSIDGTCTPLANWKIQKECTDFFLPQVRTEMSMLLHLATAHLQDTQRTNRERMHAGYRVSIQNALDYLQENFTKKIYLKDVCQVAQLSPTLFQQIFRQIIGMPFTDYLIYLRVLHARRLLMTTDRTLYDICRASGFASEEHFCRMFKSRTGHRPSFYRNEKE